MDYTYTVTNMTHGWSGDDSAEQWKVEAVVEIAGETYSIFHYVEWGEYGEYQLEVRDSDGNDIDDTVDCLYSLVIGEDGTAELVGTEISQAAEAAQVARMKYISSTIGLKVSCSNDMLNEFAIDRLDLDNVDTA